MSRRGILRAGAGALALGLGGVGSVSAATVERRSCNSGDTISVGGGTGMLINNDWGANIGSSVDMCIERYTDGSFGWEWDRRSTSAGPEEPNYPEVLIGNKPWSKHTNQSLFPIRRGDVRDLDLELDVAVDADPTQGEWNLALEWWLTPNRPPGTPTHETMLVLTKSDDHVKPDATVDGTVTDDYGNTFEYWAEPDHVEWDTFTIFRTADNEIPTHIDLTSIMEFEDQQVDAAFPDDSWMCGLELGNETWDQTSGSTRISDLDVRLNGQTATTGVDSTFTEPPVDSTAPTGPTTMSVSGTSQNSLTISWNGSSDSGGSGLSDYEVSVGAQTTTVSAGTTRATIGGLSAGTSYDVSVVAIDNAGNRSTGMTTTARTAIDGSSLEPIQGKTPQNTDVDPAYEDLNANDGVDFDDVVVYANHRTDPVITDHTVAYDYNRNTEAGDFADIVELFGETQ